MRVLSFVFVTGLLIISSLTACLEENQADLNEYKWKHRIILTHPTNENEWVTQQKLTQKYHDQITDRHLLILRLDHDLETHTEAKRKSLIKKYNLIQGTHVLIGKDGGVKGRQTGILNFQKWFDLIDTMPMRQKEMQR